MPSSQDIFGFHADPNHFNNAFGKSMAERDAASAQDAEHNRIQGLKETAWRRMPAYGMDGVPGSMMGGDQHQVDDMVRQSHDENILQGGDGSGRGTAATARPYRGGPGTTGDNMASQPGWWHQAEDQGRNSENRINVPFRPVMQNLPMAMRGLQSANQR